MFARFVLTTYLSIALCRSQFGKLWHSADRPMRPSSRCLTPGPPHTDHRTVRLRGLHRRLGGLNFRQNLPISRGSGVGSSSRKMLTPRGGFAWPSAERPRLLTSMVRPTGPLRRQPLTRIPDHRLTLGTRSFLLDPWPGESHEPRQRHPQQSSRCGHSTPAAASRGEVEIGV